MLKSFSCRFDGRMTVAVSTVSATTLLASTTSVSASMGISDVRGYSVLMASLEHTCNLSAPTVGASSGAPSTGASMVRPASVR